MTLKILVFDYRNTESEFFKTHKFDNYNIKFFPYSLNESTVKLLPKEDLFTTSIISVFVESVLSQNVIEKFKNLRIIAIRATGYDNINRQVCINKNISVLNVPNYGETTVAEYTMGLIITSVRQIMKAFLSVKNNDFSQQDFTGRDLSRLTLGVIGTGATGASVCRLASAFKMKILAFDIHPKKELTDKYNIQYTDFETLLKTSDIVSLHVPYTKDNYHMISQNEFEIMKDGSHFINVSRGELVNNIALKEALDSKKLKSAALDVVACENYCKECDEFTKVLDTSSLSCLTQSKIIKELATKDNVIITPHIAYETQDAINYILQVTFENIIDCINGGNKNRVI